MVAVVKSGTDVITDWWNYDPVAATLACMDRNKETSDRLIENGVAKRVDSVTIIAEIKASQEDCGPHTRAWAKRDGKDVVMMAVVAHNMSGAFERMPRR